MAYTRKQFIEKIAPLAVADSKTSRILASITIAQGILESNNGNSRLTTEGNALFGIKPGSYWRGKVWTGKTVEYYNGAKTNVTSGFRAYNSWHESVDDHSAFLTGLTRYKKVVGETDYKKAARALKEAGYATDPQYANKLIKIIEDEKLYLYDRKEDKQLKEAAHKVAMQFKINECSWDSLEHIDLKYAKGLIEKLGGLDKINEAITKKGMSFNLPEWKLSYNVNKFKKEDIRSLLIKFAAAL